MTTQITVMKVVQLLLIAANYGEHLHVGDCILVRCKLLLISTVIVNTEHATCSIIRDI